MLTTLKNKFISKPLQALYLAQFLSAFVDNMILFVTQAIIKSNTQYPSYYLGVVQCTFFIAFILLAPWVGKFADKKPKSNVLIVGNVIKAAGVLSLLLGFDPAISYAIVGVGAVVYSPAKYGLLPFLTNNEQELLKANSKLESYTILAILGGTITGGILSDKSVFGSIIACVILYLASIAVNLLITKDPGNSSITYKSAIPEMFRDLRLLFVNPKSRFSLIGTGSFWMTSASLRLIIFAWVPLVLGITDNTHVSGTIALTGVGIVIGALVTPRIITIKTYHRVLYFGLGLAISIFVFVFITNIYVAMLLMLTVGMCGGIYIVPMNSVLQNEGHHTIGAGKTIAIQNLFENIFMLIGAGAFTIASGKSVPINSIIFTLGTVVLAIVMFLYADYKRNSIKCAG